MPTVDPDDKPNPFGTGAKAETDLDLLNSFKRCMREVIAADTGAIKSLPAGVEQYIMLYWLGEIQQHTLEERITKCTGMTGTSIFRQTEMAFRRLHGKEAHG